MKKLLLLFMLVMLPLQASWGVVSVYCQPEQPACVTPCYYGAQEAFVDTAGGGQDNAPAKANMEHDANSCHVYCMPLIGVSHTSTFPPSSSSARQPLVTRHLSAMINERPERPQWSDVA